jgi:hypothetical protein
MRFTKIACAAALGSVVFAAPQNAERANKGNQGNQGNAGGATAATAAAGGNDASLTLSSNAIQSGSFVDGSEQIGNADVGQAKSLTSQDNFINFCSGKTLQNGLQILTGSCNGIGV